MKTISELKDGDSIYGQFLVNTSSKGTTNQSKTYMNVTLQDATGTIEAKKWEVLPSDAETLAAGNVVLIQGEVLSYKDNLQMKIFSAERVSSELVDAARFVPSAPVAKEVLEAKLDAYLSSIKNEDVSRLANHLVNKFRKQIMEWPAAVKNHHNYVLGLLHHSITMADMAEKVCEIYPSINRDVLIAGAIIHDLGKTIELSGPVATKFTLEGKLLGHISIMQGEIREAAKELGMSGEIPVVFEHMILAHHTKPEYGSPVPPLTREALVLAMIDDMDAKMTILDKAYKDVKPGDFTARLNTMDERYFYLPLYTQNK
ncbi:MAG: HD domain-containing protein [Bacilli bacterium]|nr:HD domain-containing protein [Bacilli bacterium]